MKLWQSKKTGKVLDDAWRQALEHRLQGSGRRRQFTPLARVSDPLYEKTVAGVISKLKGLLGGDETDDLHKRNDAARDAFNINRRIGTALYNMTTDLEVWFRNPDYLCCLIRILLINLQRRGHSNLSKESMERLGAVAAFHDAASFLRLVASMLESRSEDEYSNLIQDLLTVLGRAMVTGVMGVLAALRSIFERNIRQVILKLNEWLGGPEAAGCLPAKKMLQTFTNTFLDPNGLINYIMNLVLSHRSWTLDTLDNVIIALGLHGSIAKSLRVIADVFDAIADLAALGIICNWNVAEQEPVAGIEEPESHEGVDPGTYLSALLDDAVEAGGLAGVPPAHHVSEGRVHPIVVKGVPDNRQQAGGLVVDVAAALQDAASGTYVPTSDIAAVLQKAFGYTAGQAKQAALAATRRRCRNVFSMEDQAKLAALTN